ncbi:MAG: hypothetical protein QNJ40_17985 [Xanthomonadales bacterium]|nr:hypothetical protein [Xanthomonadales bacterium]
MMAALRPSVVLAGLLLAGESMAQDPPGTDIFLLKLAEAEGGHGVALTNITDRQGYDNQPYFSKDGWLYYTRIENGQADIFRYDPSQGSISPVTRSPESEYSPKPLPGEMALSVIRVGADNRQLLETVPLDGLAQPRSLFPDIEPVGYHAWITPETAALFVLGEPMTLQVATLGGKPRVAAENIGRALVSVPGRELAAFVLKSDSTDWAIKSVNADGDVQTVITTLPRREDFAIGPDGRYWMGDGSKLYHHRPGSGQWTLLQDFAELGLTDISRLAVSPNGKTLALVSPDP